MNQIILYNNRLPVMNSCELYAATEPFFHSDRTLDFHVLIFVIEGIIHVTEDQTDYAVSSGELLFLKGGIRHYGKIEIPKGTRWYFIHFHLDQNESLPPFIPDSSPIGHFEHICFSTALPKKLSGLAGSEIEQALSGLVSYMHSEDYMKKWECNRLLFSLLCKIAFYNPTMPTPASLPDKICEFLSAHYTEPFSASVLEQTFFLSYKHLAVVFKRKKGITMQQYHNKLRMEAACKLLRSTFLSIGEISEQVGFNDTLYFSRCFHRFSGMSPSEYRKKLPSNYYF